MIYLRHYSPTILTISDHGGIAELKVYMAINALWVQLSGPPKAPDHLKHAIVAICKLSRGCQPGRGWSRASRIWSWTWEGRWELARWNSWLPANRIASPPSSCCRRSWSRCWSSWWSACSRWWAWDPSWPERDSQKGRDWVVLELGSRLESLQVEASTCLSWWWTALGGPSTYEQCRTIKKILFSWSKLLKDKQGASETDLCV